MSIRVFLADDHTVLRDGLRLLLETSPEISVVGSSSDGFESVDEVLRLQPDVVVMDIGMPGLNGIEATRIIRRKLPGTEVVILSVHASTQHVFNALQAGANGYVLKESAGAEVVKAIEAVHEGRRVYFCGKVSTQIVQDFVLQGGEFKKQSPIDSLSGRERQILQLVVEGRSSSEIADIIHISSKTVETYRCRLMRKLGIDSVPSLVRFAILHGLIPLE